MRLADFIPPLLTRQILSWRSRTGGLSGAFGSWDEAVRHGSAYDEARILERVQHAALRVKRGEAAFERDSVCFDQIQWPFPLLACLLRQAVKERGKLTVIDFGGSLGSTYQQCRAFLNGLDLLRWCVVEQPHYVESGRALFQTEELRFYSTIKECVLECEPHVALFSGVLQYLPEPDTTLREVAALPLRAIVIDRTPWADAPEDIITVQRVTPQIFPARLPFRIFAADRIGSILEPNYRLMAHFSTIDPDTHLQSLAVKFGGWLFESPNDWAKQT